MRCWHRCRPRQCRAGSPWHRRKNCTKPEGAAIAGWEQFTIDLTAGAAGLRNVLVVLAANEKVLSANDAVLYCCDASAPASEATAEYHQESIGGRFEEDGSFRGTRWKSVTLVTGGREQPQTSATPSEPSAADVTRLRALVAEVLRRAGPAR